MKKLSYLESGYGKIQTSSGFTLVELIVVITIIAILGTIGFITLTRNNSDARDAMRLNNTKIISRNLSLKANADQIQNPLDVIETTLTGNIISTGSVMKDYSLGIVPYTVGTGKKIYFGDHDFFDPVSKKPYPIGIFKTNDGVFYQVAASMETGLAIVHGNYFQLDSGDMKGIIQSTSGSQIVENGKIYLPY